MRAVRVVTVGADHVQYSPEYAGEVRARIESRLGFRVSGKIIRRQAELGQRVKAGDVLAQLDSRDFNLSADAAHANLSAALTNRNLAAADFKRYKDLRNQNFISDAQLEHYEATLKSAQAQLDQAQAQASGQANQAGYTSLVADVSGVVTSVDADPGQVVAAGTQVVRLAQDGARDVVFSVPEDKISLIKAGSQVEVKGWGANEVHNGVVREIAASTDPVTRTFSIKVSLAPGDKLALGTTVTVLPKSLDRSALQVVKLPTSAFFQDGGHAAVWVLDPASMTVKAQEVKIATADGNEVVVVAGLTPGMQVVSAGVHVLSPGQKVTRYKEPATSVAAASAASAAK